ncbi:MAG: molybdate ABC transporter substrate-binding protein [Gammaproteobacteria bacterium]|jgi:molybdate transport system substrate-binding protein|nr:molybdate ABC transporter substrate-binding protein [Chromatiales bacterium]MDP6149772.1 molybdate ABC transporter substrate-binding protein [Gammaproteobacteria bacterium]MDP7094092.1 molybdate ABC transporter substrate-binding protein [Gammaproteobacteria bacterium]MDP7297160.1 molybdate ABC transporter substrate-binding protein [Gammaproteobacteria bacterium]HJP04126.1 molybdate ABC transporter substrate-binding protein [Gammaproteobacteria bacterium]
MRHIVLQLLLYSIVTGLFEPLYAADLRVAVASNFADTLAEVAAQFESETGQPVIIIRGSTGKLYAQILNGAPFDIFLAADSRRPELLEDKGRAVANSRFSYAAGRLVLWSLNPTLIDREGKVLATEDFRFLAIANPMLAPYGEAARQTLENLGLWESLRDRMVLGENISQTFQFVASGNATLGLVARSQQLMSGQTQSGSFWEVPTSLHEPIVQQGILLQDKQSARAFTDYMQTQAAEAVIVAHGYDLPGRND